MATAKPKVKRMMFGGVAKGVAASMQGAAKKAVASKTAPKQMQFMSDALRSGAMKPPTGGAANPNMQKVNTSVPRGAIVPQRLTQQQAQQREMARTTANAAKLPPARPVTQSQMQAAAALAKSPLLGKNAGMTGIGSQMAKNPQMGGVNSALKKVGTTVSRAVMGKKAGGLAAGHKEADGIAKKGKTRAMQVKMAGGGKTKKYC